MKSLVMQLRRFLKDKNTVTILCTAAAIIVLYVGYTIRINNATAPVRVPYAKVEIQPRTLIDDSMIGYMEVPGSMVSTNVVRVAMNIIGKYSNFNTVIPAGSMFYSTVLVDWKDMPDSAFANIPDGNTVVSLSVNYDSTFGNSIFPGNYIDLYVKTNDGGKVLFGKFIESIKVLAVKDGSGKNVFENSENLGTPSALLFSVPEDLHLLLRKAIYVGAEIVPVPRNANYCANNDCSTNVTSEYIQKFILNQTVKLEEENKTNPGNSNANGSNQQIEVVPSTPSN